MAHYIHLDHIHDSNVAARTDRLGIVVNIVDRCTDAIAILSMWTFHVLCSLSLHKGILHLPRLVAKGCTVKWNPVSRARQVSIVFAKHVKYNIPPNRPHQKEVETHFLPLVLGSWNMLSYNVKWTQQMLIFQKNGIDNYSRNRTIEIWSCGPSYFIRKDDMWQGWTKNGEIMRLSVVTKE